MNSSQYLDRQIPVKRSPVLISTIAPKYRKCDGYARTSTKLSDRRRHRSSSN
ncbi:hypothetical protein [Nostoc sp. CALU 546]|uniref:hypothetical protein n=1 Tax=Nostoc sp. CALU 546 TaxID=1867241 RepID=UPI003B66D7AC